MPNLDDFVGLHQICHFGGFRSNSSHWKSSEPAVEGEDLGHFRVLAGDEQEQREEESSCYFPMQECLEQDEEEMDILSVKEDV